jgi:hypothetical protein
MPMNFPDAPTDGATFTSGASTWTWFATPGVWKASTAPSGAPQFLPLIGGTMTGALRISGGTDTQSTTFANFTPTRWRLAVSSGDDPAAGAIDYRSYATDALSIVGAGTAQGSRIIQIFDNMRVNGYVANVTPPADLGAGVVMAAGLTNTGATALFNNVYITNTAAAKLIANAPATALNNSGGGFGFYIAPAAAAGSPPAWAATLGVSTSGASLPNGLAYWCGNTSGTMQSMVGTSGNRAIFGSGGLDTAIYSSINVWTYPAAGGNFVVNSGSGYQPGGGVWSNLSDSRIKRDVADYTTGLDAVCRLRPVTYQFNGRGFSVDDGRTHVGLVADEVEGVMPEMVGLWPQKLDPRDAEPSDVKTLNTNALTYALVNAVKELAERIEQLEARIAA